MANRVEEPREREDTERGEQGQAAAANRIWGRRPRQHSSTAKMLLLLSFRFQLLCVLALLPRLIGKGGIVLSSVEAWGSPCSVSSRLLDQEEVFLVEDLGSTCGTCQSSSSSSLFFDCV
jgi:hypothetical protein